MPNISFLACTEVELYDLTVCIVVNGETLKVYSDLHLNIDPTMSNIELELFSYSEMCLNFMPLDRFIYLGVITQNYTHTHTHTHL